MSSAAGPNLASPKDTIVVFKTSGTFTPNFSGNVEVLVVAGGGGGGMDMGGGGGGGGVLTSSSYAVTAGTLITVTVGAGGYGAPAGSGGYRTDGVGPQPGGHQFTVSATNGGNSIFGSLTALGGGFGASSYYGYTPNSGIGGTGGSGGGCSGYTHGGRRVVDNGTPGQGFSGGNSGDPDSGANSHYSGGGGGAGQRGADGPNRPNGGNGVLNDILGTRYYWAGGGGGASHPPSSGNGGHGGLGGGGGGASWEGSAGIGDKSGISIAADGKAGPYNPGGDGAPNTGGGGGGGTHYNSNNKGGEGGSGIVIVRFLTSQGTASATNSSDINQRSTIMHFDIANTQKSWKGAPTINYVSNPTSEVIAGNEFAAYTDLSPIFDTYGEGYYSISADIKTAVPGSITVYTASGGVEYNIGYYSAACETYYKRFYFNNINVTRTNPSETVSNLSFYGGYGSGIRPSIKNVQVEKNSFCTPFVVGTRSNTQAILDLTNINTLTASNLTYTSDNTFNFNGSTSLISVPSLNLQRDFTLECWVYLTSAGTSVGFFGQGPTATNQGLHIGWFPGRGLLFGMYSNDLEGPGYNMTYNTWHNFVFTYNHSTYLKQTFADGVLVSSGALTQYAGYGQFNIGAIFSSPSTPFVGNYAVARVYRRALSTAEVKQNFNATRFRYGI